MNESLTQIREKADKAFARIMADAVALKDRSDDPETDPLAFIGEAVMDAPLDVFIPLGVEFMTILQQMIENAGTLSDAQLHAWDGLYVQAVPTLVLDIADPPEDADVEENGMVYLEWLQKCAEAWAMNRNWNHVGYDALIGTDDELLEEDMQELLGNGGENA